MDYSYDAAVSALTLKEGIARCKPGLKRMIAADYDSEFASLALLDDYPRLDKAAGLAKHFRDTDLLIVCGIGGSNLGAMSVAQALLGSHYEAHNQPTVLWADTVDSHHAAYIVSRLEEALLKKQHVVLNIISKSGTTTETVALATVLIETLKSQQDWRDRVVVTTDKGSKMWSLAEQEGFHLLEIPKMVGGRYSVFSPCGIFPLAIMDIDVMELFKGAIAARGDCLQPNDKNPALKRAITLWHEQKNGKRIHNLFLFSHQLEMLGKWYRQLLAESLGKEKNKRHRTVHAGITPIVSVGSVDLHSMAQLYLDGPNDKVTTFVKLGKHEQMLIPVNKSLATLVSNVQGKNINQVMEAILGGVQAAYRQSNRPFMSITLDAPDEKSVGYFLQQMMIEVMLLGELLQVNAFDQPAVEKYKNETRRLLAGK